MAQVTAPILDFTAGIAFIHRRVDLDEVVIGTGTDVTATSRNDTSRHRPTKTERIADCDYPVANTRRRFRKLDARTLLLFGNSNNCRSLLRYGA